MKLISYLSLVPLALGIVACSEQAANTTDSSNTAKIQTTATASNTYSAEQFYQTTTVFGSSINHNGTAVLVSSDATGVFNVYRYPIDGSAPTQLSKSDKDTVFGVSWFPNDDRFLYSADQGGNELNHLYVQEQDGTVKDLTPGENLKASFMGWLDDGSFYVKTNERDAKAMDVYHYNSSDYSRELVFKNEQMLSVDGHSNNGQYIALVKAVSGADTDMYLADLTSDDQTPKLLSTSQGAIEEGIYTFTADSTSLIYGTNEFGEYNQAWSYNIATKERSLYYKSDWDVSFVDFSKDGKYATVGVNNDAQTQLHISDVATGKAIDLPKLPAGDLRGVNFSNDSSQMVFYINSDVSPSNLFTYKLGSASANQLTETLNADMRASDLVASEVVRFKSFDGLVVPGLLYKPKTASAEHKVPALVWVHGGPGGQSRKGYRAVIQHLVNQGYAIFAVNNRGSSGYGKTFYHLDDKNHGENDLQDIVYGKKHLQSLDWVDADKIGVIGGSYGGYMTMAAMAFTDEFEVGINIFGVTNWLRTLESIPPWWEAFKVALYDEMGDPATDEERLRRISPLFHAKNITKPVLVVQGANDPRVLQVESDEMVAGIRANNVPVEYVLFDDEGHGFRKKVNRITASNAYVDFLKQHL
ncbi:alpha/beta fold hydrolase [Thalassotalea nanhaiensis]|uniref:Alpha/beta fold hydrolase n=1 Tax=Thalassotalea nanhaiensis TaxID=3065648 RepID=A0ABY9THQ3_9GAMM|nr:alpha/beta fold hydrolase [Colwelliaceae bacterium SQ345]